MKQKTAARPFFRAFYHGNRLRCAAAMLLQLLTSAGMLLASWLLGRIIDAVTALDSAYLLRLLLLCCIVFPAIDLAALLGNRVKAVFIHRALAQYKSLAFHKLSQKSISAFSRENTGRYLSTLTNDVNTIEENYLNRSFEIPYYCAMFAGTLAMMCWYSLPLTGAAILLSVPPMASAVLMGRPLAAKEKAVSDRNEGFVAQIKDLLNGFAVLKSFKAEGEAQRIFSGANHSIEQTKQNRRWYEAIMTAVINFFSSILQFGIFFLGAYLAIRGDITAGTVLIFVNLCNGLTTPIQVVPQYWASRKAAAGLVEKLAEITEEHAARSGDAIPPELNRGVTLEHVTFGYQPDQPVLKDLSLTLEPGKKYAVVGGSGSGKSTLLNLLMGACDGYSGSIAIDGKELREVDPDSLYDLMSLIGQNVFLFDDTIRSNITMFRDFPDGQVAEAVRRSGLSELLERRGADYRCGENGAGLSGGERQRVSIARCLLRGTPVLLLDEATAALDNQTAFAVTDAILHLDGLTRLVVTHRLDEALMAQYDEILVLRDGQIQERGDYETLMAENGYFYSLYTLAA